MKICDKCGGKLFKAENTVFMLSKERKENPYNHDFYFCKSCANQFEFLFSKERDKEAWNPINSFIQRWMKVFWEFLKDSYFLAVVSNPSYRFGRVSENEVRES